MSEYPDANEPEKVGTYPASAGAGGGFVWDEVLEYRVWCHPELGAPDECDGNDYFYSYATYHEALERTQNTPGAEEPLALILQRERIDEPTPGKYAHITEERLTEWPVKFLLRPRRKPSTIPDFLAPNAPPNRLDIIRGLASTPAPPATSVSFHGSKDLFAIEVGPAIDNTGHCQLDFYVCGIHLNKVDNMAHVATALNYWPAHGAASDQWTHSDACSQEPFSAEPQRLLANILADSNLIRKHLDFSLGPVTDAFSMLTFGRSSEVLLIVVRNDDFTPDPPDDSHWNRFTPPEGTDVHWLSTTIPRIEFSHICSQALHQLSALSASHLPTGPL